MNPHYSLPYSTAYENEKHTTLYYIYEKRLFYEIYLYFCRELSFL